MKLATAPIRVLLIEDNPGDARLIREMLHDAGGAHATVELAYADRLAPGLEQLTNQVTDVVLLDLTLPDSHGFDTFTTVHTHVPDVAIVVLSGLTHSKNDNTIIETSWVQNKLVFQDESFAEIVKKLERWYDVRIEIRDEKLGQLRMTGTFENETIRQALTALQIASPFNFNMNQSMIDITP